MYTETMTHEAGYLRSRRSEQSRTILCGPQQFPGVKHAARMWPGAGSGRPSLLVHTTRELHLRNLGQPNRR